MWLFYFSYSLSKHCVGLSHDSMQQLVVSSQTYTSICGRDAFSVFFFFFSFFLALYRAHPFSRLCLRVLLFCIAFYLVAAALFLRESAFFTWGRVKANDV